MVGCRLCFGYLESSVAVGRSQAVGSRGGEVKRRVVREEPIFGAVAGEAVLSIMTCILYFVEIPILVCILNLVIQLPGCQDIFITVNHSQVIS